MKTLEQKSEYDTQAETFLATNGLKFRATLSDTKTPAWEGATPTKTCPACGGKSSSLECYPLNAYKVRAEYRQKYGREAPYWEKCAVCNSTGQVEDKEARKHGHHYRVTISREGIKRGLMAGSIGIPTRLTFDFWGSIKDAEDGEHPSTYSVLACISSDVYCPETFADFCAEYGYETDSIKALQTFRRCSAFAKRLRAFFTTQELEQLSKIR